MNIDDAVGKEQLSEGENEEDALNVDIDSFIAHVEQQVPSVIQEKNIAHEEKQVIPVIQEENQLPVVNVCNGTHNQPLRNYIQQNDPDEIVVSESVRQGI